ncbi:hypothetical protein ACLOJK_008300, partial [Asimina triloba]
TFMLVAESSFEEVMSCLKPVMEPGAREANNILPCSSRVVISRGAMGVGGMDIGGEVKFFQKKLSGGR